VRVYTDVEVDETEFLGEVSYESLVNELNRRNTLPIEVHSVQDIVEQIYQRRRLGQPCDSEIDQLIWCVSGRI